MPNIQKVSSRRSPPASYSLPASQLTVAIFDRLYDVDSIEAASRIFAAARDRAGTGASNTPTPRILRDGVPYGYISYNGRVWLGEPSDWSVDALPVYDPTGELA
jgi:hypothetical protein